MTLTPVCRAVALAMLVALLGACSSLRLPFFGDDEDDEDVQTSEQVLYESAQASLRSANYTEAIRKLQQIESQFPFGRYAEQAQLEIVYAYYQSFQPEAARSAADRFIRLHPQHANVDYAYYIKGLAAFTRDRSLIDRFFPRDMAKRDVSSAQEAFTDFSALVTRFPTSSHAPDARQRMIYLRNLLADAELNVARYYIQRGAWVAAANRGRYIVENFPQTPAVPDALALMVEAYLRLGATDIASDTLRVLAINAPDHPSLDAEGNFIARVDIENADRSWMNIMTFGLVDPPEPPPPLVIRRPEGEAPPARPPADPDGPQGEDADDEEQERPWYRRIPFFS